MNDATFDWKRFHSYRVFDEFLEQFVLKRKSYITRHSDHLDLGTAFKDIRQRFVAEYDGSTANYEEKVLRQFDGASKETKIVFTNVEYLWAMPMANLKPKTKRAYSERWFSGSDILVDGERYFFGHPHIIADPGPWYLRNKYWELVSLLGVLSLVATEPGLSDLFSLKRKIAEVCHTAIHENVVPNQEFPAPNFCGVHCALMHLANPERYESIISASHRRQICAVLGHIVEDSSNDPEEFLKQIRSALYHSHGSTEDPDFKYRWFFYSKDVVALWIDKKTSKQQLVSSAVFDVRLEEEAIEIEGMRNEVTGFRIQRSTVLVNAAKKRDQYTCRACNFHFENQIVHVHHLDPISEYTHPKETTLNDLITLCPTCHYIAHYWLHKSPRYKKLDTLLSKLGAKSFTPAK